MIIEVWLWVSHKLFGLPLFWKWQWITDYQQVFYQHYQVVLYPPRSNLKIMTSRPSLILWQNNQNTNTLPTNMINSTLHWPPSKTLPVSTRKKTFCFSLSHCHARSSQHSRFPSNYVSFSTSWQKCSVNFRLLSVLSASRLSLLALQQKKCHLL